MKLWFIAINNQGWYYPGGTANVAISRLMLYNTTYHKMKEGRIQFRRATTDEENAYIKSHPDSRFARSRKLQTSAIAELREL